MCILKLTLFAGFHLEDCDGNALSGNSRKSKALLAWLALNPDHEHPREKLAGILWPDSDEVQARHSLRQALADLRKIIPPNSVLLQSTKDWILLDSEQIEVDALNFDKDLIKNNSSSLDHAIKLYQGELLEGCNPRSDTFEDWLFNFRGSYSERAATIISRRLNTLLDKGDFEKVTHLAMQLLSIDTLRESAYRALMHSHLKLGNHTTALKWYQRCAKVLQQELAVSPSLETEALYKKIIDAQDSNTLQATTNNPTTLKEKRALSNNTERLLYLINTAITGILEHNIGQSFLIRGLDSKKITIAKKVVELAQSKGFFYCHKKVELSHSAQAPLIELSQTLATYLFDPTEPFTQKIRNSDNDVAAIIQKVSTNQPILLLIEHIHNSTLDLQLLLAELISSIGNNAILLVMTSNIKNDPLGSTLQETMIGAPLTTIDINN